MGYNDILSFLQGSQPNYAGAMSSIQDVLNAKMRRMQPQTHFFGANKFPIKDNQITSGLIDAMGNYHQGQGGF